MGYIEKPPYNPPFIVWFEIPGKWKVPETWNVKDNIMTLKPINDVHKAVKVAQILSSYEEMETVYVDEENGRVIWEKAGERYNDPRDLNRIGVRIVEY